MAHYKKLFNGIEKIEFQTSTKQAGPMEALGMYSSEGEYVTFDKPEYAGKKQINEFLLSIEKAMQACLSTHLTSVSDELKLNPHKRDAWVKKNIGMLCILASQIQWTANCTWALESSRTRKSRKPLKSLKKKQNEFLSKFSDAIKGNLTRLQRLKFEAIVTYEIHARDVIEKIYRSRGPKSESSFEWLSQLRYYLEVVDVVVNKVTQLFETKISRHSVILVGEPGSAKSTTWRVLKEVKNLIHRQGVEGYGNSVTEYVMNPKALSLGELYGDFDYATEEWSDGILPTIFRKVYWLLQQTTSAKNKRIVCHDIRDFGWMPYITAWFRKCPSDLYRKTMTSLVHEHVAKMLDFKRQICEVIVPITDISCVASLCRLLECFTFKEKSLEKLSGDEAAYTHYAKLWFLFCMIWSICGSAKQNERRIIDSFIREREPIFPPKDTVYEYAIDKKTHAFVNWRDRLNDDWMYATMVPFYKVVVPTIDTIRFEYLISSLIQNGCHVLMLGPVGTGKTSMANKIMDLLSIDKYSALTINMSAHTSSNMVQDTILSRFKKRAKGVYIPQGNKTLVTFLDDMNMPAREKFGAQPPLELIRQWMDYRFCSLLILWIENMSSLLILWIGNISSLLILWIETDPDNCQKVVQNSMAKVFTCVHTSVTKWSKRMLSEIGRHNYTTLTNYIILVRGYKRLLNESKGSLLENSELIDTLQSSKKISKSNKLQEIQNDFEEKLNRKEELNKKTIELKDSLERATLLLEGLSEERIRWEDSLRKMDEKYKLLPGDCLLGTAFLTYLGPFISVYREALFEIWIEALRDELVIPYSTDFTPATFLSSPAIIREWAIRGLPLDNFSTENGLIITQSQRYALVIDPQGQALKWIKQMEMPNDLQVIDFSTDSYMKILEKAMEMGTPVLLQNVTEHIESAIKPVLDKNTVIIYPSSADCPKVQKTATFDYWIIGLEAHLLAIVVRKEKPELENIKDDLVFLRHCTLVDYWIIGLEAHLLAIVVRKEKPELENIKDDLVVKISEGKKTLKNLENELLRLLNESKGSLLENSELIDTLQSSKKISKSVNEQLRNSLVAEKEIDKAREGYRSSAVRASILFFVLNALSRVDPMYQYSLTSYIKLFEASVSSSKKSDYLEERITHLNEHHTYAVYSSSKKSDYLEERITHLNEHHTYAEQPENPSPIWISGPAWDNISELSKLDGFYGLVQSLEQMGREWNSWYFSNEPENVDLVSPWNTVCDPFQKMLIVRCLRQDRMLFVISRFVEDMLGPRFVEPLILDLKTIVSLSCNTTPLLFILSPGVDSILALTQLAKDLKIEDKFTHLSLGQGQIPLATKLIREGQTEGKWVYLANCHLSLSWMPKLDKLIELLPDTKLHPQFRLWLSSSPHPDFPASILRDSLKMTTEPPKGIKANMKRLYRSLSPVQFYKCLSQFKYKKLLYALSFLHSLIIERKKFQTLGWNVVYSFNDSDFEISENILSTYLDEYKEPTPWAALQYLIAEINYGGHVTDQWDRRLLKTYSNQLFYSIPICHVTDQWDRRLLKTYSKVAAEYSFLLRGGIVLNRKEIQRYNVLLTRIRSSLENLDKNLGKDKTPLDIVLLQEIQRYNYTTDKNLDKDKTPLDIVLLQEIQRYNVLLTRIRSSLENLGKALLGQMIMSPPLEAIFQCIHEGNIPADWLRAYPSLKPLGSWVNDLIDRVAHFQTWASTVRPPVLFWPSYTPQADQQ
ncbi:dynein heavy chain 2, axonemal-like [Diaphorina citri]|uniref:Dynein heavy chain 2, axonemal-like n=1 Tax=Diaphorina citri TaxID=121845 RepID=A0A3Q0JER2_DIACI|nr:dynein heavy chain 2, axonemal-like [Diaphorina citri]